MMHADIKEMVNLGMIDVEAAEIWGSEREKILTAVEYVLEGAGVARRALLSIASNTCCDGCQEAARVAKAALEYEAFSGPANSISGTESEQSAENG